MAELSPLTQKLVKELSRSSGSSPTNKVERVFIYKELQKFVKNRSLFSIESFLKEINCSCDENNLQKIIDKYFYIIDNLPVNATGSKITFIDWLLSVASCEIEQFLNQNSEDNLLFYTFNSIKKVIEIDENIKERDLLLYIAIQQAIFRFDKERISYHVLKMKYEKWENYLLEDIKKITPQIYKERREIMSLFQHPQLKRIYLLCKSKSLVYTVSHNILEKSKKDLLVDPEHVEKEVSVYYKSFLEKIKKESSKLITLFALFAIATKTLFLLFIEIPFFKHTERVLFNDFTITLNALLPTILITTLVLRLSSPGEKNRKKLNLEVLKILYKKEENPSVLKLPKKEKRIYLFINLIYFFGFLLLASFSVWSLSFFFPIFSSFIFTIYLIIIAYLDVLIRESWKEVYIIERKENYLNIFIDIFAFPLIMTRKWMMTKKEKDVKKINISFAFFKKINISFSYFKKIKKNLPVYFRKVKKTLREKKENIYKT
jgi:hypothetical protein